MIKQLILITVFCLILTPLKAPFNPYNTNSKMHKLDEWNRFKIDFAYMESSLNPDTINQCSKFGLYQFGNAALSDIGLDSITCSLFRSKRTKSFPVWLQHLAFKLYAEYNLNRLYYRNVILKDGSVKSVRVYTYSSKIGKKQIYYINGRKNHILITKSGLIASCHLVGHGKVKLFLRKGIDSTDGNGVRISEYMKMFNRYKI